MSTHDQVSLTQTGIQAVRCHMQPVQQSYFCLKKTLRDIIYCLDMNYTHKKPTVSTNTNTCVQLVSKPTEFLIQKYFQNTYFTIARFTPSY